MHGTRLSKRLPSARTGNYVPNQASRDTKKVGPDHSARETLADYNDHRFRMLYRDADGFPEQHDNVIDVVIVQSGEGTLVVGGKMINPKGGGGAGEYLGTKVENGTRSGPPTSFTSPPRSPQPAIR
jgi:hypothetical protein